jgi:hypothetical protein
MTKERKGFAANERNGQSWWLANKREREKKITGGASPAFFYFIFNIALLNRI